MFGKLYEATSNAMNEESAGKKVLAGLKKFGALNVSMSDMHECVTLRKDGSVLDVSWDDVQGPTTMAEEYDSFKDWWGENKDFLGEDWWVMAAESKGDIKSDSGAVHASGGGVTTDKKKLYTGTFTEADMKKELSQYLIKSPGRKGATGTKESVDTIKSPDGTTVSRKSPVFQKAQDSNLAGSPEKNPYDRKKDTANYWNWDAGWSAGANNGEMPEYF